MFVADEDLRPRREASRSARVLRKRTCRPLATPSDGMPPSLFGLPGISEFISETLR
jgi:hypothetical protein